MNVAAATARVGGADSSARSESKKGDERILDVSLVIPAHNEEHRLRATLEGYAAALAAQHGDRFEIVIAVNGSTDRTAEVARAAAQRLPSIVVLDNPRAVGKGGAVLEGVVAATGDRVIFADADGATSAESLLALVEGLDEADVAIGSRRLPESEIPIPQALSRRALGWLFAATVRTAFGLPYRDTQCGAKAFRWDAAQALADAVTHTAWTFDVDLLLSARRLGLKVVELPVVWSDQAGSSLHVPSVAGDVGGSLWELWRRERLGGAAGRMSGLPQRA